MPKHVGNKLSAAAVRAAAKPGLYGDGHGLYLQVSAFNTKAWVFRYQLDGGPADGAGPPPHGQPRRGPGGGAGGPGSWPTRALIRSSIQKGCSGRQADARRGQGGHVQAMRRSIHRGQPSGLEKPQARPSMVRDVQRDAARQTVFPAATQAINDLPVSSIDTGLVLKVLEPIWATTPETASRIRGRIEAVLDWAKVRGYRDGENPARWRGHLDKMLPARSRAQPVEHHAAVPYADMPAFMAVLRARAAYRRARSNSRS